MILRFSHFFLSAVAAALFVLCSLTSTAYATLDEYDFVDEEIKMQYKHVAKSGSNTMSSTSLGPVSGNTTDYKVSENLNAISGQVFYDDFIFYNEVESIVDRDYTINLTFFGLWNELVVYNPASSRSSRIVTNPDPEEPDSPPYKTGLSADQISLYEVWLYDANGEYVLFEDAECSIVSDGVGSYNLFVDLPSVPFDVYKIWVRFHYDMTAYPGFTAGISTTYEKWLGFSGFYVNWNFQSPADGGIGDLVGMFGQLIEEFKQLPANIWSFIEEGLVGLFVPGEEDIAAYQDKWDQLLEDHLGGLYETGKVIDMYVKTFEASEQETIKVPTIRVPLPGNEKFVFGGWEVDIVPDGLTIVFLWLRKVISVLATILFINAMRNRFENLIGGASSA